MAEGGGDEPESLLEALYRMATMDETAKGAPLLPTHWRPREEALRAVIVFTDATFKTKPVEPAGATMDDIIRNHLKGKKILLQVYAPEFPGFDGYDQLAQLPHSEWYKVTEAGGATPQEALVKYTSDQAKFKDVLAQLGRTISKFAATETVKL